MLDFCPPTHTQNHTMHALLLATTIVTLLFCGLAHASFKVSKATMSRSKYDKTYKNKKEGAAYIRPQDLPAIGDLLREKGISQVWISHFNGKQYEDDELTVKMVSAESYRRVFEEHLWLKYGPEPASFVYQNRAAVLIPLIVSIEKKKLDDKKLHALYWDDGSDEESEEEVERVRVSPRPRRHSGNPQRHSVNLTSVPNSGATVIMRSPGPATRHNHHRQTTDNGAPTVSVRPVFNPPSGPAPAHALYDQSTGGVPPEGASLIIPGFTTRGPISPRGNNNNTNPRQKQRVTYDSNDDQEEY